MLCTPPSRHGHAGADSPCCQPTLKDHICCTWKHLRNKRTRMAADAWILQSTALLARSPWLPWILDFKDLCLILPHPSIIFAKGKTNKKDRLAFQNTNCMFGGTIHPKHASPSEVDLDLKMLPPSQVSLASLSHLFCLLLQGRWTRCHPGLSSWMSASYQAWASLCL